MISQILTSDSSFYTDFNPSINAVEAGDSLTITVTFKPGRDGLFNETLTIISNAKNDDSLTVALIGDGGDITGPLSEISFPVDQSYSSNTQQTIKLYLKDERGIDTSSIRFTVLDSTYDITSPALTFVDSILTFNPADIGLSFSQGQAAVSIDSTDDTFGNHLQNPQSWSFMVDTSPPVASNPQPADGANVSSSQPDISVKIYDSYSYIEPDSIQLTVGGTAFTISNPALAWNATDSMLTFSPLTAGISFADGETVNVSLQAKDHIDYGTQHQLNYNWSFAINMGGPVVSIYYPLSQKISSNSQQDISLKLKDANGIDTNSIRLTVGITTYDITSPALTFVDSILTFNPADIGLSFSQGQVAVSIDSTDDTFGNHLQNPQSWSFMVDTSPPVASNPQPADGANVSSSQPDISVKIYDTYSYIEPGSIQLTVKGTAYTVSNTALSWNITDSILTFSPSTAGISFADGDTVNVSLQAKDHIDYGTQHSLAGSSFDWSFNILYSGQLEANLSAWDDSGIDSVLVRIYRDNIFLAEYYTDENGRISIAEPADDSYAVTACKPGYFFCRTTEDIEIIMNQTTQLDIKLGFIGDFDVDNDIDFDDLAELVIIWYDQVPAIEFAPAAGSIPDLSVQPDSTFDFEDLMVFTQMWNWWHSNNPSKLASITWPETKTGSADITLIQCDSDNGAEYDYYIFGNNISEMLCSRFIIQYDPETMEFVGIDEGDLFASQGVNSMILTELDEINGLIGINIAVLDSGIIDERGIAARLKFNTINGNPEDINFTYEIRESGGGISKGSGTWEAPKLPETFSLKQNYPNPFNPETTIEYALPRPAKVSLKIFNINGQEIASLVDEMKPAGIHRLLWNAESVSSGIYFYSLKTEGYSDIKKCIIMK